MISHYALDFSWTLVEPRLAEIQRMYTLTLMINVEDELDGHTYSIVRAVKKSFGGEVETTQSPVHVFFSPNQM